MAEASRSCKFFDAEMLGEWFMRVRMGAFCACLTHEVDRRREDMVFSFQARLVDQCDSSVANAAKYN